MAEKRTIQFTDYFKQTDRKGEEDGVAAFLANGGKVVQLVDSKTAEQVMERRKKIQSGSRSKSSGIKSGIPLFDDTEALTVKK